MWAFAICGYIALRFGHSLLVGGLCLAGMMITAVITESRSPLRGLVALHTVFVGAGLALWAYWGFSTRRAGAGVLYSTPLLILCAGVAVILFATAWRLNRR
jgi:hypothetical protein